MKQINQIMEIQIQMLSHQLMMEQPPNLISQNQEETIVEIREKIREKIQEKIQEIILEIILVEIRLVKIHQITKNKHRKFIFPVFTNKVKEAHNGYIFLQYINKEKRIV